MERPHPDLVAHDEPPGFRTRISILSVFRLGEVESLGLAFAELSRSSWPKQTRAFELRYKREILAGLLRGSPTDGLQRLSPLRKTGHVLVLI